MAEAPRRPAAKKVADLEPPSALARYFPYLAVGAVAIALVVAVTRNASYSLYAGAALVAAVLVGLGYVAWQHEIACPPDDGFRKAVLPATLAVVLPALGLVGYTLFPPPAAGSVVLDRAGASGEVRVSAPASTVIVDTAGAFKPDVGTDAVANYAISVARGRDEELVEGTFTRRAATTVPATGTRGTTGSTDATAARHVLQSLRGAGTYRVALDRVPESVQLPIRATVRAEPFAPWMLWCVWGALALLTLVVDAALARRGSESAYAAALGLVLAATLYLHAHYTPETLSVDLFAAGLVGVFGGGVGGEIAARVARKILGA